MHTERKETDYLIVGAGAMGMAFADIVLSEQPRARLTIVDKRAKPGGHWVDGYPFVKLHQPAAAYGVNSLALGRGGSDLSRHSEILAYYERVMKRFLDSGRVEFLPMCEYLGERRAASLVDRDRVVEFDVHERIVDGTYMNVEVPATHTPSYEIDPGVNVVPLNELARIRQPWEKYVVIGAGKTGVDAVLFLLDHGVDPDRIQWVVSNDMWMWNRARVQPGDGARELLRHAEVVSEASSLDEIFLRLEAENSFFRIDKDVMPTKWRCATVNPREFDALRTVGDVVRYGRVQRISPREIHLDHGSVPTGEAHLHVDCSANGLAARTPRPLFEPGLITLQSIMMCQQTFSAAVIGHLESKALSDAERNAMLEVVPHPETTHDMPFVLIRSLSNLLRANRRMPLWLKRSRLNIAAHGPIHQYLMTALRAKRVLPEASASLQAMQALDQPG